MKTLSRIIAVTTLILALAPIASAANPYTSNVATTTVREAAILTTADVLSTTWTLSSFSGVASKDIAGFIVYSDFTISSATNVKISPAGAITGNPAAADYSVNTARGVTYTAGGKAHTYFDKKDFGTSSYYGLVAVGTGTMTTTSLELLVRPVVDKSP